MFRTAKKRRVICESCGSDLSESHAGGPCPACLMQLGLEAWQEKTGMQTRDASAATMAPSADPLANVIPDELARLFPELEILHLIGSGGMGAVYCARQRSLGRLVALKIVKPETREQKDFAERFTREARALGQLKHPNIVTVYDFGQRGDTYFFLMEYVDGINLRQMLRAGKLQPHQALAIVPAICDALQYAHDNGVVHRDIKPENILIDTSGDVHIADFGLAKLLNKDTVTPALTQAHQVMGTMHYMAPEQWERPLDVDHRADIYSLGVVFYELLTGELPIGRFAPPSKKVEVDIRLDEIVLHTLEKEPSLRYQRVSDLKSDMQTIKPNQYVAARPAPPVKSRHPYAGTRAAYENPALTGPWPSTGFFGAATSGQTYRNLAYLFLSFPLGLLYFVSIVVGLSTGVGTLIVWVGGFILIGTFLLVHGYLRLEKSLARTMLRAEIPSIVEAYPDPNRTLIDRVKGLFMNRDTWLGIVYLIVKFPMGILSLVMAILTIALPLAFFALPASVYIPDIQSEIGDIKVDTIEEAALLALIGIPLLFVFANLTNLMATAHAGWARLCLGRKPKNWT